MLHIDASRSGTFLIGGDTEVNRTGFGAMRITGRGIWGEPDDRARALETLRRLPQLGVNFVDTANSYGPDISEQLIREALHPYNNVVVATKAGLVRTGPDAWHPLGRPEYLIQKPIAAYGSSVSIASIFGNCTGLTRVFRATSSSMPSGSCSPPASSVTPVSASQH